MFIHDLEFIESGKERPRDSFSVEGGASAGGNISATTYDSGSISVTASASASGDLSRTGTNIGATVIDRAPNPRGYGGYIAGYGAGYTTALGVERYGRVVGYYDSKLAAL